MFPIASMQDGVTSKVFFTSESFVTFFTSKRANIRLVHVADVHLKSGFAIEYFVAILTSETW
jgi:hypothetical protein